MELARCPECKAPIGGTNHNSVAGVKSLGKTGEMSNLSDPGYILQASYDIGRLGLLATATLRYIIHSVMYSLAPCNSAALSDPV